MTTEITDGRNLPDNRPPSGEYVSWNGKTWTPDLTPLFDLTDEDFLDHEEPVLVRRNTTADAYNSVKVEYCDRDTKNSKNNYASAVKEAKDQADLGLYGPGITGARLALFRELSAKNANWKKVYEDYAKFRADENMWFRFAEAGFDDFMQAQKL